MNTFVVEFIGDFISRICGEINRYAEAKKLEIVNTDTVFSHGTWCVIVVFRKEGSQ